MTLDDICRMTGRASTLAALHACREDGPGHIPGVNHWRIALRICARDNAINARGIAWLSQRARQWDEANGKPAE